MPNKKKKKGKKYERIAAMQDVEDWFKMFGVNGSVLGVVSLTDIELMLKIVMLILTCIWTTVKILKLIKE